MLAETRVAPGGQLRQRHGIRHAAAGRVDRAGRTIVPQRICASSRRRQVARVEHVAHLLARPVEPDVAQRASPQVGIDPVRKDSLVRRAELPCSCQYAAAVDPDRKTERLRRIRARPLSDASFVLP